MSQTSWLARQRLMWVGAEDLLLEPQGPGSAPSTAQETPGHAQADPVRGCSRPTFAVFLFFKAFFTRNHAAA